MKKIIAFNILLSVLLINSMVNAGFTQILNPDSENGLFAGNDSASTISQILGFNVTLYEKWEGGSGTLDNLTLGDFIYKEPGEAISGTWQTENPIQYFSLKAGNSFALFASDQQSGETFGSWATIASEKEKKDKPAKTKGNSSPPALSHFSAWNCQPVPTPVPTVPTPGAIALASVGTVVITRFRKRMI